MKRYVRIFALLLAIVTLFSTTTFQAYATTTDLNNINKSIIDTSKLIEISDGKIITR